MAANHFKVKNKNFKNRAKNLASQMKRVINIVTDAQNTLRGAKRVFALQFAAGVLLILLFYLIFKGWFFS